MRKIKGKMVDIILFFLCFALLVLVIPRWLCVFFIAGGLCLCAYAVFGYWFHRRS